MTSSACRASAVPAWVRTTPRPGSLEQVTASLAFEWASCWDTADGRDVQDGPPPR